MNKILGFLGATIIIFWLLSMFFAISFASIEVIYWFVTGDFVHVITETAATSF